MWRAQTKHLAVLLLLAGGVCPQAFAGGTNIPDWVRQAAATPLGTYPPETKAVVLLDQTDYTVTAPGEYVEHSRWVAKILRPEGREEAAFSLLDQAKQPRPVYRAIQSVPKQ